MKRSKMQPSILGRWLAPVNRLRELTIERPVDFLKIPGMAVLIILFAIAPIIVAMLAGVAGHALGCNINEGGTDECVRMGIPVGTILSAVFTCGWFVLFTLPVGFVLMIMWLIKSSRRIRLYVMRKKAHTKSE